MNRIPLNSLAVATATSLFSLAPVWCIGQANAEQVPAAPTNLSLTLVASSTPAEVADPFIQSTAAAAAQNIASAQWTDIKDDTFDEREHFYTGLGRLQAKVDLQIAELTAKRAAMVAGDAATDSWDFAMKEMENARSYLLAMGGEARAATRDNWDQMKLKVGHAWQRTQNAYAKVRASTTT